MAQIKVAVASKFESLLGRLTQHDPDLTDIIATVTVDGVLDQAGQAITAFDFKQTVSARGIKARGKIKDHGNIVFEVCYQTGKFEIVECSPACETLTLVLAVEAENLNNQRPVGRRRL